MRISRVFVDQPLEVGSTTTLVDQTVHYLSKVLRLSIDADVVLFNNDGFEYLGRISNIAKKQLQVNILEKLTPISESLLHTILGIGISRGERMDYAIQKSCELGVSEIVPLFTDRGEVKLKGDRIKKRQAHWQQVVISACEQSGRVNIPTVHRPVELGIWIKTLDCSNKFIFDHRQAQKPNQEKPEGKVAILIGAEGGFSESEIALANKEDFTGISLGPRVLRTETAPVAALSVLQFLWGDFQS